MTDRATEKDVGRYYVRTDGTLWQLVSYAAEPTATWRMVDDVTAHEVTAFVGSLLAAEFTPLYPADRINVAIDKLRRIQQEAAPAGQHSDNVAPKLALIACIAKDAEDALDRTRR